MALREGPTESRNSNRSEVIRESRGNWGRLLAGILIGGGMLTAGGLAAMEFINRVVQFGGH